MGASVLSTSVMGASLLLIFPRWTRAFHVRWDWWGLPLIAIEHLPLIDRVLGFCLIKTKWHEHLVVPRSLLLARILGFGLTNTKWHEHLASSALEFVVSMHKYSMHSIHPSFVRVNNAWPPTHAFLVCCWLWTTEFKMSVLTICMGKWKMDY